MDQEPYLGDLVKTQILEQLFAISHDQRDDAWKQKMLANIAHASFECGKPQVAQGPDGFPYFTLNIPEPNKSFQCFVIDHLQRDHLMKEGYGIVINLKKSAPDWVFSYGDVVNYHINKEFYTTVPPKMLPETETLAASENVLVGQPSEQVLPAPTRVVLKRYLETCGLNSVKILEMIRQMPEGPLQEIVFNITPDQFASDEDHEKVMRRISWFLPRHYSYVSMRESAMDDAFQAL